jgi:simple sugar transport system ATP-binding protein/ribose transport system ATP-binding protein
MTNSIVELQSIHKRFDGVEALKNVSLTIETGTVHALVGENGAGKSTLGKIIAGVHRSDQGRMLVDGHSVTYTSPRDALKNGIAMISQEVALIPKRSVIDNVFLGIESTRYRLLQGIDIHKRYEELTNRTGIFIPPHTIVSSLRIADQKKVEVLRAVARNARLIVMDEPTAALSSEEIQTLYSLIESLKAIGTTIIYVSHFLEEVLSLSDTITILRNGQLIRTSPVAEEIPESLVEAMLGKFVSLGFPEKKYPKPDSPAILSVESLAHTGHFSDVSLAIRAGEIVGLAGLAGSGRTEVCRAIFGADRCCGGVVRINGEKVNIRSPRDAVRKGLALLPESRKLQGLILNFSSGHNVTLPHLKKISLGPLIRTSAETSQIKTLMENLDIRPPDPKIKVGSLSGGNQQKVLFAKWLFEKPIVFIADEPTAGVDVGAKRAIYQLLHMLASEGMAVLLISSDLDEVLGLAHRVYAMRKGQIVKEFSQSDIKKDDVMHAIFATEKEGEKA